jgi:dimethylaniline monooxygenase (N-oxide forming)
MTTYNTIIIGSGISGIFTLKHLIEEGNTDVLVLDKNPEPFGVWNINNKPSVFENTYCVSSKLYMTISDFPLPEKTPEFPHHSIILNYYKDYAKHFDLYPYIRQNCTIHTIRKENDKWTIRTNDKTYYASYVVIATGTVNDCPNIPNDEFYKNFTGEMYHSDEYEKIKNVEGKNILIVGGSDTASDCAMELKNKNNVTVSIKNGAWFQNRNVGANEPADMVYYRTLDFFIKNFLGKSYINDYVHDNVEFWWGNGGTGIDIWQPKCNYLNSYYVKSREVVGEISKGSIIPQNGIKNIDKKKITFATRDSDDFDIILFCTGYKPLKCMKFLSHEIVESNKYKHIYCRDDPSIMFVGFIRPYLTSIPMISELQSRWISKFICGNVMLPSLEIMDFQIKTDAIDQQKEFPCAYDRLKTIVDPYDYCNMIADKIDANINTIKLFFDSPTFLYIVLFGSWNHHVYRLNDNSIEKRNIAIKNINAVYNEKIGIRNRVFLNYLFNQILFYFIIFLIIFFLIYRNFNLIRKAVSKTTSIKKLYRGF